MTPFFLSAGHSHKKVALRHRRRLSALPHSSGVELPRKIAIGNRDDEARPQSVFLFDWKLKPAFTDAVYREFGAQNRVEGYALFATLGIPLGTAGK